MSNRLGGKQGTAYVGTNANNPPNVTYNDRDPNEYDSQNYSIGDEWLNYTTLVWWKLSSLAGDVSSKGPKALWERFSSSTGDVTNLEGNSGGVVGPDVNGVINVVGDGTTIDIVGDPLTNTLTVSAMGTGTVQSLHTDDGNDVTPTAGVINVFAGVSSQNCGSSVEFTGSGNTVTFNVTDADNNTIIGKSAGNATLSGTNTTILGEGSGSALTTGDSNTFISYQAGSSITTGSNNIIIGQGNNGSAALANTISIGSASVGTSIDANVFIGNASGASYVAGGLGHNTAIGSGSLESVTSGYYNVCTGHDSGKSIVSAQGNAIYGHNAGSKVTGSGNAAFGHESLVDSVNNTGLTTGEFNVAIGYTAGSKWTSSESNNICIGTNGVSGENAVTRIGAFNMGETPQTQCFIQGINGVTPSGTLSTVVINSNGQLGSSSTSQSVRFAATKSADETNATGDNTTYTIICDTVAENIGSGYNSGTGVFTAPVSGLYYFNCNVDLANIGAAHTIGTTGFANHSYDSNPYNMSTSSSNATSLNYSFIKSLNATDTVGLSITVAGGTKVVTVQGGAGNRACYFSGFLIGS